MCILHSYTFYKQKKNLKKAERRVYDKNTHTNAHLPSPTLYNKRIELTLWGCRDLTECYIKKLTHFSLSSA